MPNMPNVTQKSYTNQANLGGGIGGITSAPLRQKSSGSGFKLFEQVVTGMIGQAQVEAQKTRTQDLKLMGQKFDNTVSEGIIRFQQNLIDGKYGDQGGDYVTHYLFGDGKKGSILEREAREHLGIDDDGSVESRMLSNSVRSLAAKNFTNTQQTYTTMLGQRQVQNITTFYQGETKDLNFTNKGMKEQKVFSVIDDSSLGKQEKIKLKQNYSFKLNKQAVENVVNNRKAFLDSKDVTDGEYRSELLRAKEESLNWLKEQRSAFFTDAQIEKYEKQLDQDIRQDIKDFKETKSIRLKEEQRVQEDYLKNLSSPVLSYREDTTMGKLNALSSHLGGSNFNEEVLSGMKNLDDNANRASGATGQINPSSFNFQSVAKNSLPGAFNEEVFVDENGIARISDKAEKKIRDAGLGAFLGQLNSDPVHSNSDLKNIWLNGTAQEKAKLKEVFFSFEKDGETFFKYKSFEQMMIHRKKKFMLEDSLNVSGTVRSLANAKEDEAYTKSLVLQAQNGDPMGALKKLLFHYKSSNITPEEFISKEKYFKQMIKSGKVDPTKGPKIDPAVNKILTETRNNLIGHITGAFMREYPGTLLEGVAGKIIPNMNNPQGITINGKLVRGKTLIENHIGLLREKVRGKLPSEVIPIVNKYVNELVGQINNGHISNSAKRGVVYNFRDEKISKKNVSEVMQMSDRDIFLIAKRNEDNRFFWNTKKGIEVSNRLREINTKSMVKQEQKDRR